MTSFRTIFRTWTTFDRVVILIVTIVDTIKMVEAPAATVWSLALNWLTAPKRNDPETLSTKEKTQATNNHEIDKTDYKTEEL